jgi:D-arabinose 1-dehydrogenase-like Zn-dependent alcohol dehydrogenase
MGSFAEFKDAVKFCEKHEIHPVVHTVYRGLEQAEEGYKTMKEGSQFGKLVIDVSGSASKL